MVVQPCCGTGQPAEPARPDAVPEIARALLAEQAEDPVQRLADRTHRHSQRQFQRHQGGDQPQHQNIEEHVAQSGLNEERADLDSDLADQPVAMEDWQLEGGAANRDDLAKTCLHHQRRGGGAFDLRNLFAVGSCNGDALDLAKFFQSGVEVTVKPGHGVDRDAKFQCPLKLGADDCANQPGAVCMLRFNRAVKGGNGGETDGEDRGRDHRRQHQDQPAAQAAAVDLAAGGVHSAPSLTAARA
jgi:hypothetical protein